MRAALVLCPSWNQAFPTFSPALLSAHAQARGHEASFFDLNKDFFVYNSRIPGAPAVSQTLLWGFPQFVREHILEPFEPYFDSYVGKILASRSEVVGFTIFGPTALMSFEIARKIKARDPSRFIVFGGPACFDMRACRSFISSEQVDAVVVGEGDEAFPGLLDALERKRNPASVRGVLTKDNDSDRLPLPPPADLDRLPTPDFSDYDLTQYSLGNLTLESNRGCVRHCVFCSDWQIWKKFRQKSASRIVAQMKELLERHPQSTGFLFSDSLTNGDMRQLSGVADSLIESGIKTTWRGYAIVRPEMTPSFLEKLRASGCVDLHYGVETGSDKVSRDMEKNVSAVLNARVLQDTRQAGMSTLVFILVGFLTETEEDFLKTLDFIDRNAENIGCLSVSICNIYNMESSLDRYDIPKGSHPQFWQTRDGSNNFRVRLTRYRRALALADRHGLKAESTEPDHEGLLKLYELTTDKYFSTAADLAALNKRPSR